MSWFCRSFFLLLLYVSMSACAYIHSLDENLPQQIEIWIKNKEYGKALDTLYYIQADNANYGQLIKQKERIIKLAGRFEKEILEKGQKYQTHNDWHQAAQTYEYGLDKLPDSRPLQKAYTQFLAKRAIYLKQLKLQLLQNKAKWLSNDSEIRKEIARVIPSNYSARWLLQDNRLDIDSTSKTLIECVNESVRNNELDVARQCLKIARQLNPSPHIQQRLIDISKQLEQEIEHRSRKISRDGQRILRSAKLALAKGDFLSAHQSIKALPAQDTKNGQVLSFRDKLDEQTEDYVDKTILDGRTLYSSGQVQEAYLLWKSLKPLSPDNERLQILIDRAEKVLKKLHSIGSKQDTVAPPDSR